MNMHVVPESSLDADLIALGPEFEARRDEYFTLLGRVRGFKSNHYVERWDDMLTARGARVSEVVKRAAHLPARTLAELQIKARMAEWESENLWAPDQLVSELRCGQYAKSMILWSIVCDLLDQRRTAV